jgi:hypothetical protein
MMESCNRITQGNLGEPPSLNRLCGPENSADDSLKYEFKLPHLTKETFLKWKAGELWGIEIITQTKNRNRSSTRGQSTERRIPVIYVQLIAQLVAEDNHGEHNSGHEAVRRQSYARQVLDHVAKELKGHKGSAAGFRSKVLNPILQRYLGGIPDCYTPSVRAAIAEDGKEPTIADATKFYLAEDPTDTSHIPRYRRNLLYISPMRWFLGTVLGNFSIKSVQSFDKTRSNHDKIMEAMAEDSDEDAEGESDSQEAFNGVEIDAILDENLQDFFSGELAETVGIHFPFR